MKIREIIFHPIATMQAKYMTPDGRRNQAAFYDRVADDVEGYGRAIPFIGPSFFRSEVRKYRIAAEILRRGL